MNYRVLHLADLERFLELRMEFLLSYQDVPKDFQNITENYLRKHMKRKICFCWQRRRKAVWWLPAWFVFTKPVLWWTTPPANMENCAMFTQSQPTAGKAFLKSWWAWHWKKPKREA